MNFDNLSLDDKELLLSKEGQSLDRHSYNDFIVDSFLFNGLLYDVFKTKSLMPFLIGRCLRRGDGKLKRIVMYEDLLKVPSVILLHLIFTTNDRSISYKLGENDDSDIYQLFDFFVSIPYGRTSEEIIQIEISKHPPPPPSDFESDDRSEFSQSKFYDDNIDLSQQSDEFWNDI